MTRKITAKTSNQDDKINSLVNDLKRVQADFINYKARTEANRRRDIVIGQEQAIAALLPVLDNLDRAIAHEPKDIKNHSWVKGITQMVKQLDSQLESIGVLKIDKIGEEFDPRRHEAIAIEESDGDCEVISEVLQTGYQFVDSVIRPAKVRVKRVKA